MSASPPMPCPPVPPPPLRPGSKVLPIIGLVLLLIIVVCGMAVWIGVKYLSHNIRVQVAEHGTAKQEVTVSTPAGSINVRHDAREGSLDLPVYPGATRVADKDSASVDLDFGDAASVQVRASKYQTDDSTEKVRAFYKECLETEGSKFTEKNAEEKTVFDLKKDKREEVVEIKREGGKTLIQLVQVLVGTNESN